MLLEWAYRFLQSELRGDTLHSLQCDANECVERHSQKRLTLPDLLTIHLRGESLVFQFLRHAFDFHVRNLFARPDVRHCDD
ncbi:MAG: hypothetical protein Greene101449_1219, partial [Candidatus Peregrinibacteria bacterium Greene1014_49]